LSLRFHLVYASPFASVFASAPLTLLHPLQFRDSNYQLSLRFHFVNASPLASVFASAPLSLLHPLQFRVSNYQLAHPRMDEPPAISRDELTPALVYSLPNSGCARSSDKRLLLILPPLEAFLEV
jgi:hypothetical protein